MVCRHNQELEQDALATQQEKAKLQQEADSLAQQLEAVLLDKFATSGTRFDADTPIDKTMKFLQSIIMVPHATGCLPYQEKPFSTTAPMAQSLQPPYPKPLLMQPNRNDLQPIMRNPAL